MHFMTGVAQCRETGEHCFTILTVHFSSLQAKPGDNGITNAAGGMYRWEFSTLTFKIT